MQAAVAVGTNEACLTAAVRALAAVLARHPDPAWWLSPEALVRRLTAQEAFALPAVLKASMAETVLRMAQRPAGRPMS